MARLRSVGFAALCAFAISSPLALAATVTTTLPVSATVLSVCIVSALPLAFGNYSGAQNNATTSVTVTCSLGATYNVGLDAGASTGATVTTRKMTLVTNTLNYSIARDAAYTQNWGVTIGTDTEPGTGSGLPQAVTVYGRIPAGQFSAAGAYTDTVGVTVTY